MRADEPLPLTLTFEAPAECGSADDIRRELSRIVATSGERVLAPVTAEARVTTSGKGGETRYATTLVTDHEGQRGERNLEARSCPTLIRSLTLVLALTFGGGDLAAITPVDVPEAAPAEVAPPRVAPPATIAEPPKQAAPEPPRAQRPRAPVTGSLVLGGGVVPGLAPRIAGRLSLGARLAQRRYALSLTAFGLRSLESREEGVASTRYDGLGARASACYVREGILWLEACGEAQALALRGRASGERVRDGQAVAPVFTLGPGLGLVWPLHARVRLRLAAALDVALSRPRFRVSGLGDVQRVSRFLPTGGLFVELPF